MILASELRHDALAHKEAQAGAHPDGLGGKERLEDAGEDFSGDADSVVAHLDDDAA